MLLYDSIKKHGLLGVAAFGPNEHNYYVDKRHANALDANDGEHGQTWERPFATIAFAITRNNAEGNSYDMSNIYVAAGTYIEDLTDEPKNVNIIGVGAKTRLQGTHTFSDTNGQNWHWINMQFRDTSGVNFTITSQHYAIGWHGCTFENSGSATGALKIGACMDLVVEDCRFIGNPVFTTAIQITGNNVRGKISKNLIGATTTGILIDSASVGYGNLIDENVIGRTMTDPNSSAQMTRGISSLKSDGHSGFMIVNNRIEAVDGIYFAHTSGTNETDACLGNILSEAGTGSSEVLIPAT